MAGRKPQPTKLKVLHGNPGKRALNKNEPQPELTRPEPPEHISAVAKEEWNRISSELYSLKLLSNIDRSALAAYCQAYARWVDAEKTIGEKGLLIKTTNGNVIQSPLVGIANTSLQIMHKFLVEFGMTPSSRSRITVGEGAKGGKFEGLIGGKAREG